MRPPAPRPRRERRLPPAAACALLALAALLCGCADLHQEALDAFAEHRYDEARQKLRALASEGDEDFARYAVELGVVSMYDGDLDEALRALKLASQVMHALGGDPIRGWGSVIVKESLKRFRGEPFERAMADLYIGALSWLRSDGETARIAFRRAVLADQESEIAHREDFALAHYLLAVAARQDGDDDTFRIGLEKAAAAFPANPHFQPARARAANLVVLVETGAGPRKTRTGLYGSFAQWRPARTFYPRARVSVDGKGAGPAAEALDLYAQAIAGGGSPHDVARGVKAGAKTAGLVTAAVARDWRLSLGALLFGLLLPSEADVRQVELLPARVLLWSGTLAPGERRVEIVCAAGREDLPDYVLQWDRVRILEKGVTLLLARVAHGAIADRPRAADRRGNDERETGKDRKGGSP